MYLGIDFGKKRIGLALGAVLPKTAGVLDGTKNKKEIISEIKKICQDNEVEKIVIGLPVMRSGSEGELAKEIRSFAENLETNLNIEVDFEEEELTSVEAESFLKKYGKGYNKKDGKTDELAAVLILEQYLSHLNSNK
jgi:putative Holliday junction resolvase